MVIKLGMFALYSCNANFKRPFCTLGDVDKNSHFTKKG